MEHIPLYNIHQTLNGWSVVDSDSKQPLTPIYYIAHCADGWSIANSILVYLVMGDDHKLKPYEGYKYSKFYGK